MADLITIDEQICLRRAGFKVSFIAKKTGRSSSTMVRRFAKWGVTPDEPPVFSRRARPRKLDGREDEVRRLHLEEGLSTRQMEERLGVSKMTILKFMHARGIPVRGRSEATTLRFNSEQPPRRERGPTTFDSDRASAIARAYWSDRRRRDALNAKRRARRQREKAA